MSKYTATFGFGLLIAFIGFSVDAVSAQDLGSSGSLFKTSKKTKKKAPVKKKVVAKKKKRTTTRTRRKKTASKTRRTSRKRRSAPKKKYTVARKKVNRGSSKRSDKKVVPAKKRVQTARKIEKNTDIGTNKVIVYGGPSRSGFSERFENAIKTGNIARNQRDYVRAENAYKLARKIDSFDSRAIYGLGNIYSDQQRWEEAEQAYRQAISLEPESGAPYLAISYVLTQPVVGTNLGKRYLEAEEMARKALALAPGNPIAHDQLGVAMESRGVISKETQDAYRKAIALEPTFALAYAHLGRILRRNGLTKQSSEAYRKSIQLATDVPTMILVADVMQSQQRYLDSEQLLRKALSEDSRNPTALFLLGRALTIRKSFTEAEQVLKKSVEVSPNSFVSYALLGSLYSRRGQLMKAEQTLNRALSVISVNEKKRLAQEFEEVGDGFTKQNRRVDAVRVYRKALSLDQKNRSISGKLSGKQGG